MEATKEKSQFVNGVNTEQLFDTIDLIKENPDMRVTSISAAFWDYRKTSR